MTTKTTSDCQDDETGSANPSIPSATGQRVFGGILLLCVLGGAVAAVVSLVLLRHGIKLTPDSWSYWEGSVSLLRGKGYHDFAGNRVWSWPPGYSIYLAGWEFFAGVSGRTLVLANVALSGLAAFTWTAAVMLPFGSALQMTANRRPIALLLPVFITLFIALLLAGAFRAALAHNLAWTLYPLVLYLTFRILNGNAGERWAIVLAVLNAGLMSLLVLTHYSFVFLPPVVAATIFFRRGGRPLHRWREAGICAVVPVVAWKGIRLLLGTTGSHKSAFTRPKFTWSQYAHQVVVGLANLFADPRHRHLGEVLLAGTCVILIYCLAAGWGKGDGSRVAAKTYLFITGGFLLCLYVVFNKIFIWERLDSDRFIVFVGLTVFPAAAMLFWNGTRRLGQSAPQTKRMAAGFALAILLAVPLMACQRTKTFITGGKANGGGVDLARVKKDRGFAYNVLTIRDDYAQGPPKRIGKLILVSPEREFHGMREEKY